jgi:serine/threonine protein kinase
MSQQKLSWVGLMVEDSIIEENLGEGSFSFLFKGTALGVGQATAFKLAKAADLVERNSGSSDNATGALSFFTGGTRDVRPDAEALLALQYEKLTATTDSALVKTKTISRQSGLCYYQMEYLPGNSMRKMLEERAVSLSLFANLAVMMDRLSQNKNFVYHGDLKPENIIVNQGSVKIIDPGYFGPLNCQEGSMQKVAITTTCYYPSLKPDDLYAFGVMLWEAFLGEHPLLGKESELAVGDALKQKIKRHSALGYFGFEPLLRLKPPSVTKSGLNKQVESFLLRCLRLKLDENNRLDEAPGFENFSEMHQQIMALQAQGLDCQ